MSECDDFYKNLLIIERNMKTSDKEEICFSYKLILMKGKEMGYSSGDINIFLIILVNNFQLKRTNEDKFYII